MIDMQTELEAAERAYAAEWADPLLAPAQQKQPTPPKTALPNLQVPDPQVPSQPPQSEQQLQRSRPVRTTRPPRAPDAAVTPGQLAAAQRPPSSAAAAAASADAACTDGRARRAVANRQSAARSKERRRMYVDGLENSVNTLSAQVTYKLVASSCWPQGAVLLVMNRLGSGIAICAPVMPAVFIIVSSMSKERC